MDLKLQPLGILAYDVIHPKAFIQLEAKDKQSK
jgi:hypothetical protein